MSDDFTIDPTQREAEALRRFRAAVDARDRVLVTHDIQSVEVHDAIFDVDWYYAEFLTDHATRPGNEDVAEYHHYLLTETLFGSFPCCGEPRGYPHDTDCESEE